MTKRNLLLSLFVVLGLVAFASSAMATSWTVNFNARIEGRDEGLAEATGQVVLALQTGGTVNAGSAFSITYNAPIADGPDSVLVLCSGSSAVPVSPWAGAPGTCANLGAPTLSGTLLGGPNVVTLTFSNNQTFTTNDESQIAVTVRVNASKVSFPCPGSFSITASVLAYTPSSAVQVSIGTNPTPANLILTVNCPALSLNFDPYKAHGETNASVLDCIGVKDVGTYENWFILNVAENFPQALTSWSYELILDNDTGLNGATYKSDVTNGSNFTITFSNVPAGVGMVMNDIEDCSTLDTKDPLYCKGGKLAVILDPSSTNPVTGPTPSTGGTISFTFDVTSIDGGTPESADISFKFWSHGPLPSTLMSSITANIAFSPITPTTAIPLFSGKNELTTPLTVIDFYPCETNLLFPFVTNYLAGGGTAYNNLGTNIFVANTTADPLNATDLTAAGINPNEAAGTATPQTGTCTFWLFPSAKGALADGSYAGAPIWWTSPTIAAGGTYGFDLGSVKAFATLTGYIYAKCGFQNAHGIEYITDNYGIGEPGYAAVFEGIVIPTPEFYHRTPAGDGLGESAIAPLAVNKLVQKLLFGGVHNAASAPIKLP